MNNLVVNTPGAAGQVKTAVGLWRFERKIDAATIRRRCERTHGKCGQRLPLDHRYFHAELLTATAILPCVAGKCGSLVWETLTQHDGCGLRRDQSQASNTTQIKRDGCPQPPFSTCQFSPANFHAVLVLAEVALSSKKHRSRKARLSTDEGEAAQDSTSNPKTPDRWAARGTPAAAWPF